MITGGSRGIGYACAEAFAKEGCSLVLAFRSAPDLASARDRLVAATGARVDVIAVDLTDPASLLQVAERGASVDMLVNNAGSIAHGSPEAIDDARLRQGRELELFRFINLTRDV